MIAANTLRIMSAASPCRSAITCTLLSAQAVQYVGESVSLLFIVHFRLAVLKGYICITLCCAQRVGYVQRHRSVRCSVLIVHADVKCNSISSQSAPAAPRPHFHHVDPV